MFPLQSSLETPQLYDFYNLIFYTGMWYQWRQKQIESRRLNFVQKKKGFGLWLCVILKKKVAVVVGGGGKPPPPLLGSDAYGYRT